jgi:hypothetical protein
MSVDKVKDTSPKRPIAENKIVEAKPESPPRLKTNRTLHRKARYGRGPEGGIQSLQGQLERHFWQEEKAIAPANAKGPALLPGLS